MLRSDLVGIFFSGGMVSWKWWQKWLPSENEEYSISLSGSGGHVRAHQAPKKGFCYRRLRSRPSALSEDNRQLRVLPGVVLKVPCANAARVCHALRIEARSEQQAIVPFFCTSAKRHPRLASWLAPPCLKQCGEKESQSKPSPDNWGVSERPQQPLFTFFSERGGEDLTQHRPPELDAPIATEPQSPDQIRSFWRRDEIRREKQSQTSTGTRGCRFCGWHPPRRWLEKSSDGHLSQSKTKNWHKVTRPRCLHASPLLKGAL